MFSRSKRKRWTNMYPSTVIFVTLLVVCLSAGLARGQGARAAASASIALNVDENQPPGTVVGTVAVASDSETSNSYSFLSSSPPQEFHLNSSTGIITTTVRIDRESLADDFFTLPVRIAFQGGTNIIEVSIAVNDLNDNSPVFPQPIVTVSFSETARIGSERGLPSALDSDKDANGYISSYRIESGNEDGVFRLNTFRPRPNADFSVSLATSAQLDRETTNFYILNISATDNSSNPRTGYLTVNVSIDDVNDNAPVFTQTSYQAQVNESAAIGTSVIRVEATDRDLGSNGEIVYTLKNYDDGDLTVDPDTGWITLLRSLPYRQSGYTFEVLATDKGAVTLSGTAFVTIMVEDENDHSPVIVFSDSAGGSDINVSGVKRIQEMESPNGYNVFSVSATDQDIGDNGQVLLSLYSGNERNDFFFFSFFVGFVQDTAVGFLSVPAGGNIDREIAASYNLTFRAEDNGVPQQITYRSILIEIVDANDHSPIFLQESYTARLNESVQIGSFVQSVTAYDADEGLNADVVYTISGDDNGWFEIDPETGLVTTRDNLDHETTPQVTLTITATDQGTPAMSNTTTLVVEILDDNDEYPVFTFSTYNFTVVENSPAGDIDAVSASDQDGGVYGNVMYAIASDQFANIFSVDPEGGMLRSMFSLDREETETYTFEILAYDGGTPSLTSTATVIISVRDVNDNNPEFYPDVYYATVKENEPAGLFVTAVVASDADVGDNAVITYVILNSSRFQIDAASGNITTAVSLDREEQASYTLTVTATDLGGRPAIQPAIVNVLVTDTLDNPLEFERNPYQFQLQENRPNRTVVGTVTASSLDLNVNITYVITSGDPNNLFRINAQTGEITTRRSIDREAQASDLFQISVYAITDVDGSQRQNGQTVVEIEILDINDNAPVFPIQEDRVDVVENWAIGREFYEARAADADSPPNNIILYDLSVSAANRFGINHTSGLVFINSDLQSFPEREYDLQIQASDYGTPPLSSTFNLTVVVRDVNNNAPTFLDSINTTVRLVESTEVNTRFLQVLATDADEGTNGDIAYSIIDGNELDTFGIFPSGVVYVKQALDRELVDMYRLSIEARDGGVPALSSIIILDIEILDENDNRPFFENATYNFYILEEENVGAQVGVIHAIDGDVGSNGELTYSFTTNQTYFALNSMTGVITTKVTLDREMLIEQGRGDTFMARVRVRDNGMEQHQDHADVSIHVVDINDNAPMFTRPFYQASVSELAQNETLIIRVSATDDDAGDNSYIIYSIVGGNEERHFHINHVTGQIVLISDLDREENDRYVLTVKARDVGVVPQESFVDVDITVLDENDHRPLFRDTRTEIEVTECLLISDEIGFVNATDRDINSNGQISYTITGGNLDGVFGVDPSTGSVFLTGLLDHEATSRYELNITARDGGSPSLTSVTLLIVNVRDCNDNSPIFAYVGVPEIDEELSVGSNVVRVQASDSDSGVNGEIRYSIVEQQPSGDYFAINAESGWITTNSRIDRESTSLSTDQFILTIHATDLAIPVEGRRTANVEVVIFVRDINDNPPRFTSQQAAILSSTASPNTEVTHVQATDPDAGVNGQVTYSLVTTGVPFRLDLTTGLLTLTQSVSSSVTLYSLEVRAQDAGSNPRQQVSTTTLSIIISDGQTRGPQFSQTSYSDSIAENQPVGTDILTVFASYADGRTANINYYVTSVSSGGASRGNLIVAKPVTGVIESGAILDREDLGSDSSLVATVYAVDTSSSSPRIRSVQVTVRVQDQNDNPPVFNGAPYNASIVENSSTDTLVTTVTATDADSGTNSIISYSIISGATDLFSLDSTDGEIRTTGPVDRESSALYQLQIQASDGTQSSTTTVDIHLLDQNDNDPEFSTPSYSLLVPEDQEVGTDVGGVTATDPDAGSNGEVTYSVVEEGAPGEDVFLLDPNTGIFRLLQSLDYETKQHYILTVMATDRGSSPRSSTASVYINVVDINDHAPVFDPTFYSEEVAEDVAVGTAVVTVTASDLDSGVNGALEYRIASGDPSQRFVVTTNGTIATAKNLDREVESFYNLEVVATDMTPDLANRQSSVAQVSIIVTDINDNAPRFINPDSVNVPEDTRTGVTVMVLLAQDDDVERNSYVEYSLLTQSVPFAVSRGEGNVQVTGPLDRETTPMYTLTVQATDKGTPTQSSTMNVTVYITDVNDNAPTFDPSSYHATLVEDTPLGLEFLQVSASDPDEGLNSLIRFSIVSGDGNRIFYIDPTTGVVSLNAGLDYEQQSFYSLTVRAQDQGYTTQFSSVTVTIDVTDINDNAPIFVDSYTPSITENNLPNAFIDQVSANDLDSGSNGLITYSLDSDFGGLFTIDSTRGEIRVTQALDYEARTEYELEVIAQDAGAPSKQTTATVMVTINDDNDHDPEFVSDYYTASVEEDASPGTFVVEVTATDVDGTADLRYQLNDDVGSKFTIDPLGGRIITSGVLDRETQSSYLLTVTVRDGPTRQATTSVRVEVQDVNDNPPRFSSTVFSAILPATTSQGQFVAAVQASDDDIGENAVVTYSITSGDTQKFRIDTNRGVVSTAQDLTSESGMYILQITAQNTAASQTVATATLQVEFSTATFPVITSPSSGWTSTYSENVPVDMAVTTVMASSGSTYSIVGGNFGGHFDVNSQSGVVTIVKALDYEEHQSFSLWVAATDGSNPPLSDFVELQVVVTDVNDNSPVFDRAVYFASVREEQDQEVDVIEVTASDADSATRGQVTYAIQSGNTGSAFSINPSTGAIATTRALDRELIPSYLLTVVASDGGSPPRSGTSIVVVTVEDINDNVMSFTRTYDATIPENAAPGTHIVTVHTTDADETNLSQFAIDESQFSSVFAIDPITGEITLNSSLDFEDRHVYSIHVRAFDSSHTVQTEVTINVEDVNDNAPVFDPDRIERTYSESDFTSGLLLTPLSASDADSGDNSNIEFRLKTRTDLFRVDTVPNQNTGLVYPNQPIQYIVPSPDDAVDPNTYTFSVFAVDLGTPSMYSEAIITIHVTQDNSHAPTFDAPSYFSPVTEGTPGNTRILQVMATDGDTGSNADIVYSVIGGNGTSRFNVESDTGWIVTRNIPLTGDADSIYQLKVKAEDQSNRPEMGNTTVTLLITESNRNAPVFDDLRDQIPVAEDASPGEVIITIHATDSDAGINGEVRYFLGGADNDLFNIGETSGVITLAGELDRESVAQYSVQVVAEDRAMHPQSAIATITISVTDVDDNPPVFNPDTYSAEVFENSPSATPVVTVTATDADEGANAEFEYEILGAGNNYFTIIQDTGVILTQGNLDYETGDQVFLFTVAATNEDGTMVDTAHVTITVEGVNEFHPQFTKHQYEFYVNEHAPDGGPAGLVHASDDDRGRDGVVYYLLIGGSNSQGFAIDSETGYITVSKANGVIDRETADMVTLSVLAKNEGAITGDDIDEAEVVIHILDGNDPPEFTSEQYQARVTEDAGVGTYITTVTAQDFDVEPSYQQFNYTLLQGNIDDAFEINPRTGRIQTASELDRETVAIYYLTVAAVDSGSPPQTGTSEVIVQLDDINDNGPTFTGDAAEGFVLENEPPNELVMTLSATDPDLNSDPSQFTYTLLTTPDSMAFTLNGNELRTTQTLDRETKSDFFLQIEASDGESPPVIAVSTIHITVQDRNDNPSSSRQARIEVKMFESMFAGGIIGSVQPIDPDTDDMFICQITAGDTSKFSIQSNCNLYSAAHSSESQLDIQVSGEDGTHQSVTSSFSVLYESFTNDTLTNSVTLRLANIDAQTFLSRSYDRFKTSVSTFLNSRETLIILSITDLPDINKVDLLVAVKKDGGQHLLHDDLVVLLSSNEVTIENQADITIETVDFTGCSDDPCTNNGACGDRMEISLQHVITESDPVILVALQSNHSFVCTCPAEYTGERCEIPTDYCENATCMNGATCQNGVGRYTCICTPGFTGDDCGTDIDECGSKPCTNGGTCQNLINAFYCACPEGYTGVYCEIGPCSAAPCKNGGTCTESGGTFVCQCDGSYFGVRCQNTTVGFEGGSFILYPALPSSGATISIEFATTSSNALLLYNHDSNIDSSAQFVALEIVGGKLRLAYNIGFGPYSISTDKLVDDGYWHTVEVRLQGMSVNLTILHEDCPRLVSQACTASQTTPSQISLNLNNVPLSVGGVSDITILTSRASQVSAADFVGCMNGVYVNGEPRSVSQALDSGNLVEGCARDSSSCTSDNSCTGGSVCVDEWWNSWCRCDAGVTGSSCGTDSKPVSFGDGGYVTYRVKESYKRQQLLDGARSSSSAAGRRRRRRQTAGPESVSLSFRTGAKDGLLLYIASDSDFTTLQIKEGSVYYGFGSSGATNGDIGTVSSSLNDWNWHNVTLRSANGEVTVVVDDTQKSATFSSPHEFTGLDVSGLWLGGAETPITIDGQVVTGYTGCLTSFEMNGESLPLDGDTDRFEAIPSTGTGSGCSPPVVCTSESCQNGGTCSVETGQIVCECPATYDGDSCDNYIGPEPQGGGPSIGIIVAVVVIFLLVITLVVVVVVFWRRRGISLKAKQAQQANRVLGDQKGVLGSADNQAYIGDTFDDATMIGQDSKVTASTGIIQQQPDIIEQNMQIQQNHSSPSGNSLMMENDTGEHVNIEMDTRHNYEMELEHYDLENASSLAASDMDVAYHYKHYHDRDRNRKKRKHRTSPNPLLARIQASPARLSPVSMNSRHSPNPLASELAHSTPVDNQNPAVLRRSPGLQSNYSTNNTLRIGSVPNSGRATPARSLASPVNSERSFSQSELRSQTHRSDISSLRSGGKPSRATTPLSHDGKVKAKGRTSKSPLVGLTAEEVAQLNTARPDLMTGSHASTIDDLSSESSRGRHHPHGDHTPIDPSHLLEPPDSTSDDTNDSFTCSEMESEYGKHKIDKGYSPGSVILSKLAEIELDEDSVLPHVNGALKQKRLDSRGGSLSTLFTSEDENGQSRKDKTNGDVSLERLLGWGPRFEHLVGVFKDIAQLHETNGKITLQASLTQEEFV